MIIERQQYDYRRKEIVPLLDKYCADQMETHIWLEGTDFRSHVRKDCKNPYRWLQHSDVSNGALKDTESGDLFILHLFSTKADIYQG